MKKINFSDKFGLTEAVLSGRKTQTRRILKGKPLSANDVIEDADIFGDEVHNVANGGESLITVKLPYKVGEVVAVAQSYEDAGVDFIPEEDEEFGCYNFPVEQTHGWTNKMFVRADLMPHQIRITNVRVERLNDISVDDCKKEGIYCDVDPIDPCALIWTFPNAPQWYWTPREAYAALIDKISGRGTFNSNPWVFVYDFELVK